MRFDGFNVEAVNADRNSPPLLAIFVSSLNVEDPIDALFAEAIRHASNNRGVYWIRPAPAQNAPAVDDRAMLRPNWLDRITLHYGYDHMHTTILQICTETIFKSLVPPSAIFVELQNSELTTSEITALFALLSHISKWVASRRVKLKQEQEDGSASSQYFSVTIVLRDDPALRMTVTLFTEYLIKWTNRKTVSPLLYK